MQKRKRAVLTVVYSGIILACLVGCAATQRGKQGLDSSGAGIEQVSHVRRLLRAACGKLNENV